MPEKLNEALVNFFAGKFWQSIEDAFELNPDEADFTTPDAEMVTSLEQNIYQFSSAKNYQQLKSISQALIGEDGKLRSFSQFRTAAAAINNQFINQWLQVEYNYAVAASRSASQWATIQKTKEALPLLKYVTAEDDRVRLEHRELAGIILPVDDTFWDAYYPPNGWGCRCDVYQLSSGIITKKETIVYPDNMPDMFKYNPGKQKIIFPPGHAYYEGLPDNVTEQANALYLENKKSNG